MIRFAPYLLLIAALVSAYGYGRAVEAERCRARLTAAQEASREAAAKLETLRLSQQARLESLQRSLEDEARNAPVTSPACLPGERVRRLDQLR